MIFKGQIREDLIYLRRSLSGERRLEASYHLMEVLYPKLQCYSYILSFASKEEEVNLWPLNTKLAEEGRLLFPRLIDEMTLAPYAVKDFKYQLAVNPRWKVLEPQPSLCSQIPLDEVGCVLVPGLAFDHLKHRLGYGKGHYDRFLKKLCCPFYGVGFNEQLLTTLIPIDSHDIPLTDVFLF